MGCGWSNRGLVLELVTRLGNRQASYSFVFIAILGGLGMGKIGSNVGAEIDLSLKLESQGYVSVRSCGRA